MSERYSRLFAFSERLYREGAPVTIEASALLKDNQTGSILAQLKFKNISSEAIKALTVRIIPQDVAGVVLPEFSHRYLDLGASRDADFCEKIPVPLPDSQTRSFRAVVTEVVFTDGRLWTGDGVWEPLPAPMPLETGRDAELVKQCRMEYGADCAYVPAEHADLWYCTCGRLNRLDTEETCHHCQRRLGDLRSMDWDQMDRRKEARLAEEAAAAQAAQAAASARAKKNKKLAAIIIPIVLVVALAATALVTITGKARENTAKAAAMEEAQALVETGRHLRAADVLTGAGFEDAEEIANSMMYAWAESLLEGGDPEKAITVFEELGSYLDAPQRIGEIQENMTSLQYQRAEALLAEGKKYEAATLFYELRDYQDAKARSFAIWREIVPNGRSIASFINNIVGLKADGTALAAGWSDDGLLDVSHWSDVVSVAANEWRSFGLRSDGTVVCAGVDPFFGESDEAANWTDIVAIDAGGSNILGLRSDGTAVSVGADFYDQNRVSGWSDLIAIAQGEDHNVGLMPDGTVVAVGRNEDGQCRVSGWTDIVAIAAGNYHTLGLRADGTVVATGYNESGQCSGVAEWTDIVAIAAGRNHSVGLKADGTVVTTTIRLEGVNPSICEWAKDVTEWTDIVAISAGSGHTLGLKADGTAVAATNSEEILETVAGWNGMESPKK